MNMEVRNILIMFHNLLKHKNNVKNQRTETANIDWYATEDVFFKINKKDGDVLKIK